MSRRRVAAAFGLLLVSTAPAPATESPATNLESLNARIGKRFEVAASDSELIEVARAHRIVLFGEAHDQPEGVAHFLELATALVADGTRPLRLGIEFVDRGDWDILLKYLQGALSEEALVERLWPTSLLLWPGFGTAHLEVLRFARTHKLDVLPLESRPAGARPLALRNAEIRWNLSLHLGQYARERLLVLYGVQHVFGEDAISEGIEVPVLDVTSYGDSVLLDYARRMGSYPPAGTVLRLRPSVYLVASGGPPRAPSVLDLDLGAREPLLSAIEHGYLGDWDGFDLVVAALADPEVRWRRAAFHVLRHATQHSYEYDPEPTPTARSAARQRWTSWWNQTRRQMPPAP